MTVEFCPLSLAEERVACLDSRGAFLFTTGLVVSTVGPESSPLPSSPARFEGAAEVVLRGDPNSDSGVTGGFGFV